MDDLTRATEALREISGEDPERAAATRRRLRASLEERPRGRRWSSLLAALGIGLGATTAFAFATGQAQRVWSALVDDDAPAPAAPGTPAPSRVATQPTPPPAPEPEPAITTPAIITPAITAPAEPVATAPTPRPPGPRPRIATARTPAPTTEATAGTARTVEETEALYRSAHELHFRGQDPAAALRAWDAYLLAEPSGRFAVEARYNRALLLVRLGRYREAREALAPFARGEIANAYRHEEAKRLLDRLSRLNDR